MKKYICLLLFIFIILLQISCDDTTKYEVISGNGKIVYTDIEGGHFLIEYNSDNYEPINLEDEFKVDQLNIIFKAYIRNDLSSICMCGQIVEIIEIEVDE